MYVCSGELKFVDLDTGELKTLLRGTNLTVAWNIITFSTELLRVNGRYNVTITVTNIAGSATLYSTISECIELNYIMSGKRNT